jgi:hypothetical protein
LPRRASADRAIAAGVYERLAPEVTLALSALTTITTLEHRGYALAQL